MTLPVTGTDSVARPASAAPRAAAEMSLLVDVGSAWTKASVVARSRGRWRVAASAAQPTAWGDDELVAALAARLAAAADPRITGRLRELIAAAPRIACHTPRRAGRIGLAAVSHPLSGGAARRAAESAGWVIAASVSADDGRSLADRLSVLQSAEVDAWLLTGGFDGARADQALEMAGLVAAARGTGSRPVIWAGSDALADEVAAMFGPGIVQVVPNPRPAPDREEPLPLRHLLEGLLQRVVEPGEVRRLAPIAFRRAVAELARASARRILAVDLGARYTSWVTAEDRGGVESRVFASGGLTADELVAPGAASRLARGLPLAIDELAVADAMQNLRARPASLPQTDEELAIVQAAARQLLTQHAAEEAPVGDIDLLIGAGRVFAGAPRPALAAQILLDGVRPLGITAMAIDAAGVLPPLGALDDVEIAEGMGALRDDALTPIGTAVVCHGGRSGQVAMRITVTRSGWPGLGPLEIRAGQLMVLPLGRGQEADLEIELEPGVTLGGPRHARRMQATVRGGVVGLLLDARDVPLVLPRRSDDRRAMLAAWREVLLREPALPTGGSDGAS